MALLKGTAFDAFSGHTLVGIKKENLLREYLHISNF